MAASPRILMRAASGPRLGLGHALRTAAVAEELVALGAEPVVFVDEEETADFLREDGIEARSIEAHPGWLDEAWDSAWVDVREGASSILQNLSERGTPGLLVEDRSPARERAAIVVHPSLHHQLDAWDLAHPGRVRAGAAWIPLRRCVRAVERARVRDVDLLITFGGSDPFCTTERVLRVLELSPHERTIVIVGPHMRGRRRELERLAAGRAEIREPGSDLASWMARSKRALTAVATTLNELAYFGVPTAILANYDEDRSVLEHYAEHGPHAVVGIASSLSDEQLARGLAQALRPREGPTIVGLGDGASALAELLVQLPTRS